MNGTAGTKPLAAAAGAWRQFLFMGVMCANALLLWTFHDRYWYPSDEGIYAHIAERLLSGDVLSRDVQSLHPGYINFLNAAAMRVFGMDLLSLRYPLMVAAFAQAGLGYLVLARRSPIIAAAASLSMTALGMIQFLNPAAHWYCLALAVLLIWWLYVVPVERGWRLVGAGTILGIILLFRQLSGLWVGMALLVTTFHEQSRPREEESTWLARVILTAAMLVLIGYLLTTAGSRPLAKLMVGSWPLAILALSMQQTSVPNRVAVVSVLRIGTGMIVACLPLGVYLAFHNAFMPWVDDAVVSALRLTALEYMERANWISLAPAVGFLQLLRPQNGAAFLNGLYFLCLPLLPIVNGALTLKWLRRGNGADLSVPVFAAFYALVSLHLEGSMYWYFSVGLTMSGCLWHAAGLPCRERIVAGAAVGLAAIGVWFHAGQSFSRTARETLAGVRTRTATTPMCATMPRASLRIERADCESYRRVTEILRTEVPRDATIFAVPSDAEIYFLTERRNPFRFYNTALAIRDDHELAAVLRELAAHPPLVVTFRPGDKFNNAASTQIMEYVRSAYRKVQSVDGLEVFRRTADPSIAAPTTR